MSERLIALLPLHDAEKIRRMFCAGLHDVLSLVQKSQGCSSCELRVGIEDFLSGTMLSSQGGSQYY